MEKQDSTKSVESSLNASADEFSDFPHGAKVPRSNSSTRQSQQQLQGLRDSFSAVVESSLRSLSSATSAIANGIFSAASERHGEADFTKPFCVEAADLSVLTEERTRSALADLLEKSIATSSVGTTNGSGRGGIDEEAPSTVVQAESQIKKLIQLLRDDEKHGPFADHSLEMTRANQNAEMAAAALTSVILRSSQEKGISNSTVDIEHRRSTFGTNAIADKKLSSFVALCWEAVQDFVLIMLLVLGVLSIVIETTINKPPPGETNTHWIEGAAILMSVCIVVLVTASIDYAKQFAFIKLTRSLDDSNTKSVIREGEQRLVTDADIVVGDILSVNSHSLASIPADCILLGPIGVDLKMDESPLTGESHLISKRPGDVVLSGTTAVQGSGKMVVVAVGINSVAGKIKARVYESEDHDDEDDLEGDVESPLFTKLTKLAQQIGVAGTCAAIFAFAASCIIGLAIKGEGKDEIFETLVRYFIVSVTVLAVAVPEGLPLAVTLALAFSSSKMMADMNLVKHLDACETMGCATTICTDKTGTLTANKMTARSIYTAKQNFVCTDPSTTLGDMLMKANNRPDDSTLNLIAHLVAINTMNETVLYTDDPKDSKMVTGGSGNPTEVALLHLVQELGHDYQAIRNNTRGRSGVGELGERLSDGKQLLFSSARKMMSWAVPREDGGYRLYSKGASEVVLARCTAQLVDGSDGTSIEELTEETITPITKVVEAYARRGMRTLVLAYRDLSEDVDFDLVCAGVKNSDGTDAFEVETGLVFAALVGIEDPLRPEVPDAIQKCYQAGIDVRLVTGDSPNTAVSIAYQAGILKDFHFAILGDHQATSEKNDDNPEMVASNLKPNVLMEGKEFRAKVYRVEDDGKKVFDQAAFDNIWPHLRVLARSSPDDKLTLAHGLNQSTLFTNKALCKKLKKEHNIDVFPDRQVVAMTGDGTNDAPALKRADIGFAMGIAGTQIAKDAADIILLDDNFASIVTAAKWGRNVYASIQKFLQFQLTVNIAAVTIALVGACSYQLSPLAAIQLLWVNLLMDSLASLALASEPPSDELLNRPPVNRSEHMITNRMWANMIGHATYQITVVMILLFSGPKLLKIEPGDEVEDRNEISVHYTIIFNSFVWMQLFNEVNCRNLKGEINVFAGIQRNPLYIGILLITSVQQVIMVEFGGEALHVTSDGLSGKFWALSLCLGFGSLIVQQVINLLFKLGQRYNIWRDKKRMSRSGKLTTRRVDDMHDVSSLRSNRL